MPAPKKLKDELLANRETPKTSFQIGQKVKAADRGNVGTVTDIQRDAVSVHFVSPNSGREHTKVFRTSQLSALDTPRQKAGKEQYREVQNEIERDAHWEFAAELFPRIQFPWEILPKPVSNSLQQLARSCATSANHLPAVACCLLASIVGRILAVSPKLGWLEPFIIWFGDIRESGDGKTPSGKMMLGPIRDAQSAEHTRYLKECDEYRRLSKKDRERADLPVKARGYFATDLTLEGIREDLADHPTGGIVIDQSELSAFVSSQNQYKAKGNDREAWLTLWDGNPARVVRVGKAVFVRGARPSLYGGVQPIVFSRCFSSEGGLYLVDGTAFRFLYCFETSGHYELTAEAWDEKARTTWETLLRRAMVWADNEVNEAGGQIEKPKPMILSKEAQSLFFDWRNTLNAQKESLPPQFRGFLPKGFSYALRLTGVIHCIHRFIVGQGPDSILTLPDMERGITAVQFFLGQAVDAMRLIEDEEYKPKCELNSLQRRVIEAILSMQNKIKCSMLTSKEVAEKVNHGTEEQSHISLEVIGRTMGGLGLANRRTATTRGFSVRPEDIERLKALLKTSVITVTAGTKPDMEPNRGYDGYPSQPSLPSQSKDPSHSEGVIPLADHGGRDRDSAVTSGTVRCSKCHFFDRMWCIHPEASWNSARGQEPDDEHPCARFTKRTQS